MRATTPRPRARLASALALTIVASAFLATPARGASDTAFVRVNQVGYPASSSKRAYLMSSADESGAMFAVRSGGTTVFTAPIGSALGKWSTAYPNVYALDFSAVTAVWSNDVHVNGPDADISPTYRHAVTTHHT